MTRPAAAPNVLLLFALACGSPPPVVHVPPPPPPVDPDAEIHALNRAAAEAGVSDTLHGVEVADPYRTLELETEFTERWITAQNERTNRSVSISETTRARLNTLLSIGSFTRLARGGERLFYSKREGGAEQPIVFVREGDEERALLDPVTLGGRAAVDWYYPSRDGQLLAYGVSNNGDERSTLHVLNVDTGETLEDAIEGTKWCNLAWLPAGDGFYYTRYPRDGEDGYDANNPDNYFPRLFLHSLGTDPASDSLVFSGERGTDFPSPHVSADGQWLTINLFRGWSESDVYVFDRGARRPRNVPDSRHIIRQVVGGLPNLTTGRVHAGTLYLTTNIDAPRYRVMTAPAARPAQEGWRELIPQRAVPLEEWQFVAGGLVSHYLDGVRSRVYLHELDGSVKLELELPSAGAVDGLATTPASARVAMSFESYLQAPIVLDFDAGVRSVVAEVNSGFDASNYRMTRETVRSADGTEVPVTLIHRADMTRNGRAPVLLYGYGGFNISLTPRFSRHALYWLERGGVYAVANLRGGGEFGEDWHRAGALANKPHVFEDFEAVIRWLSTSRISAPNRIAITGGSNGGLLMGAMVTRVPSTFAAAASYVGLYDMLRYHHFPPAELWVSEYGSSDDEALFPVLHRYSPYHRVRQGVAYPAVLVETADHDGRVHWAHSTKFVAALQEANRGERPIYFHMERQQGHGAGTRRSDQVTRYARMYSFLETQLEMEAP